MLWFGRRDEESKIGDEDKSKLQDNDETDPTTETKKKKTR